MMVVGTQDREPATSPDRSKVIFGAAAVSMALLAAIVVLLLFRNGAHSERVTRVSIVAQAGSVAIATVYGKEFRGKYALGPGNTTIEDIREKCPGGVLTGDGPKTEIVDKLPDYTLTLDIDNDSYCLPAGREATISGTRVRVIHLPEMHMCQTTNAFNNLDNTWCPDVAALEISEGPVWEMEAIEFCLSGLFGAALGVLAEQLVGKRRDRATRD